MRVLVACEFSGTVRDAFTLAGHDAISCDLLPTESPGCHYKGDVEDIIDDGFDLMIAHPPCTYLTCSAEWAYKEKQSKNIRPGTLIGRRRSIARDEAAKFFMRLANANIPRIAIENPVGVMSSRWRKPDQYIQPYQYGHDASKKTCLWLKGLDKLSPLSSQHSVEPRYVRGLPRWANQTDSGQNRAPSSVDRGKIRSITWQGWADAMASKWG